MNREQLQILAEIYAAQARILGMVSENQARICAGDLKQAWTQEDFFEESRQLEMLAQQAARS